MKFYIENQVLKVTNQEDISKVIIQIDEIIRSSSKVLNCIIVDDIVIYDDYHKYIIDNIDTIKRIEFILKTCKELVFDILIASKGYLEGILMEIEGLANSFYGNLNEQDWNNLCDLIDVLSFIMHLFDSIKQNEKLMEILVDVDGWELYENSINNIICNFKNLEDSLANRDRATIGDILLYEMKPSFEEMFKTLSCLMGNKTFIENVS